MQNKTKQSRKSRGFWNWRTILGVLLMIIAIGLLALNPLKNYLIAKGSQENTVANLTREEIIANSEREATFDFNDIQTIDSMTVITDGVNPNDLPVIGGIAIPELGMNLPIHLGTANEGMYYGAGTLDPNQQMGESNYALASHHSKHSDLLFAPLMNAEIGQTIYLTDLDKVYVYEIDVVKVVPPTEVSVLAPTEEAIVTLITCTPDLINRIIVQGTLIEERPISEASEAMQDAFSIEQTIVSNE